LSKKYDEKRGSRPQVSPYKGKKSGKAKQRGMRCEELGERGEGEIHKWETVSKTTKQLTGVTRSPANGETGEGCSHNGRTSPPKR